MLSRWGTTAVLLQLRGLFMRITLAVAVACLGIVGIATADSARASIKQQTEIPAQGLGPALTALAKEFDFQVLYRTEVVGTLRTQGVSGGMTAAEALEHVLSGTGLTYKYLDDKTVTIMPVGAAPPLENAKKGNQSQGGDQKKSFWSRFRLAQATSSTSGLSPQPSALSTSSAELGIPTGPEAKKQQERSEISEIIVTAQKREERLQNVPISISVMSGKELDKSTFQGVTEALNTTPGVTASPTAQGGGTVITMRGVAPAAPLFNGSSPVAYYLDGVPFALVDSAIVPDTDPYDLQRVEVLKGPQGTLYGASALSGVVRVLTNDANLNEFQFKARAVGSSTQDGSGNYSGDAAVNVPIVDGKLAIRAVVGYQNLSGWIDKPTEKDANSAELKNYRFKINAQPTEQLSIGLSASASRQQYGAPNISDAQGVSTHTLPEPTSTNYESYGLKVGYEFSGFSVTSNTSYLHYSSKDTLDFADVIGFDYPLNEQWGAHVFSQEVYLNSTQNGPWRWTAGAMYRDARNQTFDGLGSASDSLGNLATLDWTDTSKSYAMFGEISRRFLDNKLELTLGGRYFHDDVGTQEDHDVPPINGSQYYSATASFNSPTPRAVLTWYRAENSMVYGSFSEGFRSGARQPYYAVAGASGFPAVKPDKLYNYEIGTKSDLLDKHLSVDASVYYMDWKNVQQTLSVPFAVGPATTEVGALTNGPSASGLGIDLGLMARLFERLELGVNFSWNNLAWNSDVISGGVIIFPKGSRLSSSPKDTLSAVATYVVPFGGSGYEGRFSASWSYVSPQTGVPFVSLGGTPVSASDPLSIVRTSFAIRAPVHWEVTIFADNLGNWHGAYARDPYYNATPNPDQDYRVRPRTVGLQFDYHY